MAKADYSVAFQRILAVVIVVVAFAIVADADQTVYFVSPMDTVVDPDTHWTTITLWPRAHILYPSYLRKWVWVKGNQYAICRMVAPDSVIADITSLGWNRVTDTEVAADVASGYSLTGRLRYLAY